MPPSFSPVSNISRIEELTPVLEKEAQDALDAAAEEAHINDSSSALDPKTTKRKPVASTDMFKRQLRAARAIAATCQWLLQQVSLDRISHVLDEEFSKDHFEHQQLTSNEIRWLKNHDTQEKVLQESVHAYSIAEKWEALPKFTLSPHDLARIADAKARHLQEVDKAHKLAERLLVRRGESLPEGAHLVDYGERNVAEQLLQKRNSSGGKKKQTDKPVEKAGKPTKSSSSEPQRKRKATTKPDSTEVIADTTELMSAVCGVAECYEDAVVGTCDQKHNECLHFRFCDLHLLHASHKEHRLLREEVSIQLKGFCNADFCIADDFSSYNARNNEFVRGLIKK